MRPGNASDGYHVRSRKPSIADPPQPSAELRSNAPISFFLTRRTSDLDAEDGQPPADQQPLQTGRPPAQSASKSTETIVALPDSVPLDLGARRRSTIKASVKTESRRNSSVHSSAPHAISPVPSTPIYSTLGDGSMPGSPKSISSQSLRRSDENSVVDETSSQAITSSSEEDATAPAALHDSAPQLIMPSIKMPSRRPFTDRGKNIGKYKILIAGSKG